MIPTPAHLLYVQYGTKFSLTWDILEKRLTAGLGPPKVSEGYFRGPREAFLQDVEGKWDIMRTWRKDKGYFASRQTRSSPEQASEGITTRRGDPDAVGRSPSRVVIPEPTSERNSEFERLGANIPNLDAKSAWRHYYNLARNQAEHHHLIGRWHLARIV